METAHQCFGTGRYAIRCRRWTADESGLCHQHRDQTELAKYHRSLEAEPS